MNIRWGMGNERQISLIHVRLNACCRPRVRLPWYRVDSDGNSIFSPSLDPIALMDVTSGGINSKSGIVVSAVFSFAPCGYGWLLLWQEDENPPFPMKITSWFSCFMFDRRAVIGGLYEDASGIFEWKSLRDFHNLWSKPEIGVHGLLVWKPHPQFSSGGYVTRQSHVRFILSARVSMRIMWFFLRIPGRIALSLVLLSSPW